MPIIMLRLSCFALINLPSHSIAEVSILSCTSILWYVPYLVQYVSTLEKHPFRRLCPIEFTIPQILPKIMVQYPHACLTRLYPICVRSEVFQASELASLHLVRWICGRLTDERCHPLCGCVNPHFVLLICCQHQSSGNTVREFQLSSQKPRLADNTQFYQPVTGSVRIGFSFITDGNYWGDNYFVFFNFDQ